MRLHWLATTGFALVTLGCARSSGKTESRRETGASDTGGPCQQAAASVEIGTGDSTFVSLAEDDPVIMVHGPQGGWHMLGSVRVRHTTPVVNIRFLIETEASEIIADNNLNVLLIDEGDCQGLYPGMYAYLDVGALSVGENDTPPELLSYARLRMIGTVTDQQGRVATDERWVTAVPDPQDVEDGLAR
jgi:hypothetical protein